MKYPALLFFIAFFFSAQTASAASILVDVPEGPFGPGDTFVATVRLDNEGECVNATQVALGFSQTHVRAVDFGKGNSILSLWVEEPLLDNERGLLTFAGGIPGGYCGRIQGDAALSNVLGKVAFTVTSAEDSRTAITVLSDTRVYAHDGTGTPVTLHPHHGTVNLSSVSTGVRNAWIDEVEADTVPPDPFTIEVQATPGVFSGRYYLVFVTQDKQSGVDHYEYLTQGSWKTVQSPYELKGPFSLRDIQVRAVDKAGNVRVAVSEQEELPKRPLSLAEVSPLLEVVGVIMVLVGTVWIVRHRKVRTAVV